MFGVREESSHKFEQLALVGEFFMFMKGKLDGYVLGPLDKKVHVTLW